MNILDGVYGNVYPSEKLILQFHASKQVVGESVVNYGVSEEDFFRGTLKDDVKNEMLRPKLWSGLSGSNIRNASRYKYYTIRLGDFF